MQDKAWRSFWFDGESSTRAQMQMLDLEAHNSAFKSGAVGLAAGVAETWGIGMQESFGTQSITT